MKILFAIAINWQLLITTEPSPMSVHDSLQSACALVAERGTLYHLRQGKVCGWYEVRKQ